MLYSQLGYYIAGKISQIKLKEDVKEKLLNESPDSFLIRIPLHGNEKDIFWEEEGKEFSYRGLMYDVVRTKTVNGQQVFFCSNDEKEDQLINKINGITASSHQDNGKASNMLSMQLVYDAFTLHSFNFTLFSLILRINNIHADVSLPKQVSAIITPPPRLVFIYS